MGDEKRIFAFGFLLVIAASQANPCQNSLRSVALQLPSSTWQQYLSTMYPENYIPVNTLPTCSCMRTGNAPTIYEPIARPPTMGTMEFEGLSTLDFIRANQAAVCRPCISGSESLPCSVYNTQSFEVADCAGSSDSFPVQTTSTCPLPLEEVQNSACLCTPMQTLSTCTLPLEELKKCVGSDDMITSPTPSTYLSPLKEVKKCVSPDIPIHITTVSTCSPPVDEVKNSFDSDIPVSTQSTCRLPLEEVPDCISSDTTTTPSITCSLPPQDGTNCVSSGIPDLVPTCSSPLQEVTNSIASDITTPVSPYCLEDCTNSCSSDISIPMSSPILPETSDSSACDSYPLFPVDLTAPPETNTYNFSINGTIYQGIYSVPSCNYSDVNYCPEKTVPLPTNVNFTNCSISSPGSVRMYPSVNPVSIPKSYIYTQPMSNTELAVNPCTFNQYPYNIPAFTASINSFNTSRLSLPKTLSLILAKRYILSTAAFHRHQNNLDNTLIPFSYNNPPQVPLITKNTLNYRTASSPVCYDKFSSIAENKANRNPPISPTYQVPCLPESCDNFNTCSCGAATSGLSCNFRLPSNLPVINLNCLSKSSSDLSRTFSSIPLSSYINAVSNPYRSTSTQYNPSITKAQSSTSCRSCAHSLQNACPTISIPPNLVSTQCSLPLCRSCSGSDCRNSLTSTSTSEYRAPSLPNTYAPSLPAALPSIRNTHILSRYEIPSVSQGCNSFIQNDCKRLLTPGNLRSDYSSLKQCTSSSISSNGGNALDYGFTSISPNSCELTSTSSNLVGAQCSSNPGMNTVCNSIKNICPCTSSSLPLDSSSIITNPVCNTNNNCNNCNENLGPCAYANSPLPSCNPAVNLNSNCAPNSYSCTSNLPLTPPNYAVSPDCNCAPENSRSCTGIATGSPLTPPNPTNNPSFNCIANSPLMTSNSATMPACNCVPGSPYSCTPSTTPNVADNCQTTNINQSPSLRDKYCILSSPSPLVCIPTTNFNSTARRVLHMPIKTVCTSHIRPLNTTYSSPTIKPIQLVRNIYAIPGPLVTSPLQAGIPNNRDDNVTIPPMPSTFPANVVSPAPVYEITT